MIVSDWQDALTPDVQARFWDKVAVAGEDECWLWFAATRGKWNDPRGAFGVRHGTVVESPRVAWVITNGRIPDGLWVLHKCDVGLCCNPKHLFLGTHNDNMADASAKNRVRSGGYLRRKFTAEQVVEIRSLYPQLTYAKIAARFNTSDSVISRIVNYYVYRDVK